MSPHNPNDPARLRRCFFLLLIFSVFSTGPVYADVSLSLAEQAKIWSV